MWRSQRGAGAVLVVQGTAIAAVLLAAGLTAVLADRAPSAPAGHLAELLSVGRAGVVAGQVAPSVRGVLGGPRLRSAWADLVAGAGPLVRVSRSYVIHEGAHAQDELEVLQFAHGTGTLAARRTSAGIVGLYLLAGTVTDPSAAATGSAYAEDLVTGRLQPLRAAFDKVMTASLPVDLLTAETAAALNGLDPPATVGGQVVVRRAGYTVVETYLLFRNGFRRVELTMDANGSIAGLYIRPL